MPFSGSNTRRLSRPSQHLCVCAGGGGKGLLPGPLPRRRGKFSAFLPNPVSLSYLAAGREKAAAAHLLCQLQQIGFLQFELAFSKKPATANAGSPSASHYSGAVNHPSSAAWLMGRANLSSSGSL